MRPFILSEWVKNKDLKVIDNKGVSVQVTPMQLPEGFWPLLPKDIDPMTCVTYHAIREGINAAPVICENPGNLFFVD